MAGLLIFCYLKRKKMGCRNSSSQPATPSASALQSPVPEQLPQYQPMNLPSPVANNQLASPQQQLQKEIRLMIESEMTRAMFSQRNSTQKTNFESVHGHQDSSDFQLA